MSSEYIQASIEHLKYSQNGGALRARFANTMDSEGVEGWLVGWAQGTHPWLCCEMEPDSFDHYEELIGDYYSTDWYKYCEILTSDLEAR